MINLLLPFLIFISSRGVAAWLGYKKMLIPWNLWQLLDKYFLLNKPFQSLKFLHAQPPLFNGLLSILLQVSNQSDLQVETLTLALFFLLGLLCNFLLYRTLYKLTGTFSWAAIGAIFFSFNPATWYFGYIFFYPFLLTVLFSTLSFLILRFLSESGKQERNSLLFISLILILISLTRSLYPPIWSIGLLVITVAIKMLMEKRFNKRLFTYSTKIMIIVGLLLSLWPLKNLMIFGQYTSSSWSGFNLSRGTDTSITMIDEYRKTGRVAPTVTEKLVEFEERLDLASPSPVSQINKSSGGRNFNHYLFLVYNPELVKSAISYRLNNPLHWAKQTIEHYLVWTQPSITNSNIYTSPAEENPVYRNFNKLFEASIFFDLRPFVLSIYPDYEHLPDFFLFKSSLPFTLFGLVLFPILITYSGWKSINLIKKENDILGFYIFIILLIILWNLFIPCLTDGYESNRMRYAILPNLIILLILFMKDTLHRLSTFVFQKFTP